jgi:cell division protein FtsB
MTYVFASVLGLLIMFLYTVILYGTGPVLLVKFRKRPTTKRKLKVFCGVYSFCAWLGSNIVWNLLGNTDVTTGGAAILWGIIFYQWISRQMENSGRLSDGIPAISNERYIQQESEMNTFTVDTETGEVVKEEPKSPPVSFPQPVKTCSIKKRRLSFSTILLIFAFAVLAFVLFEFSYYARNAEATKTELLEKIESLEEKVDKLENEKVKLVQKNATVVQEKADLQQQLEFKNDKSFELFANLYRIGFIVDGSKYYHRFDCDIYTAADEYWAHNVEYCVHLGYPPCPQCW